MGALEKAVEWLKSLVDSRAWDYCVVWKMGDDPSSFIEWVGCCCSGGGDYGRRNVKEEKGEEHHLTELCRDAHYHHPIRTKACEALAHFPSFIPLYSGIHGEVLISNQPRWHANALDSNLSHESIGTQVLIPVIGGLIELFAAKHIPKDQTIIDLVTAHFNDPLQQEAMTAHLNEHYLDPLLEENFQNLPRALHLLSYIPRIQFLPPVTESNTHPSFEGSSSDSNPSNEHPSFDLNSGYASQKGSSKQSIGESSGSKRSKRDESALKRQTGLVSQSNIHKVVKNNLKVIQTLEGEKYQSKNLVTERNRRNRIKDGLFTLRALVPKISKMDRASILGDASEYIEELQKEIKKLQDELREIEEEDCKKNDAELKFPKLDTSYLSDSEQNQGFSGFGKKKKQEVLAEVNQIGKREFLVKFFCEQKRGGFARLMEAMNSLALQVVDANITTFNGKVLNILKVEASMNDIQPKKLEDSLIELTNQTNQSVEQKLNRD